MKRNILFVVHNLKIGGIQKITLDTARYHVKEGNSVTILLLEDKIDLNIDFKCKIQHLNLHKKLLFNPLLLVYYILYKSILRNALPGSDFIWAGWLYNRLYVEFINNNDNYDAIFINGARSMHHLHSINQDNVVYSLHLPHFLAKKSNSNIYYNFLFRILFSNKSIFTVSNFIREPIETKSYLLGVKFKSLTTIYNPCDIEKISELAKEEINLIEPFILSVGRMTKQKRFDRLISAYKKSNISQKLVIIGDGHERKSLEKQIKDLKLEKKVILHGFDKNPFKWMKKADFFVLSSDVEGFVLVVNEALACGTPVIATDCGPITEILCDELSVGISEKNSNALSIKIRQFSENCIRPNADVIKKLSFPEIIKKQLKLTQIK
ncbi:glycosyltransferase [Photobacterium aphoticum]|uniref:glycosyltransferase n=1 Tax=Photobacterium aphoticum TaxID=754436 RepID=UPI00069F2912|nr:glycosyltransferase [Photobacterium aphoticum]PSU55280.1 glycosyltransferase [Photobacterium aphoticum]GHA43890.1 hypothetical protein GCM10007086_16950 [Photobacterium aphoticum]